jgi:ATP-binding cassette subfamily F protein uup
MTVLGARDLKKSYGPTTLLDGAELSIDDGEKVGLVGVNGSGKTTLVRILAGVEAPDGGLVSRRRGASFAYLEQEPTFEGEPTAHDAVARALAGWHDAKRRHEDASLWLSRGEGDLEAVLAAQAEAAADVERLGGWDRAHEVDTVLGHLGIHDPSRVVSTLSGGERRRVALARILVGKPDLALFDEPTNHLDVETAEWLEEHLSESFPGAVLLVTHDRYLLDRVCTRTLEVERGRLHSYDGGYGAFLEAKAERLALEARTEQNRQNFLRTELEWLRRQPKARSTKQKARIERAEAAKSLAPPPKEKSAKLVATEARSGKTILELRGASLDVPGASGPRRLVNRLDLRLTQGERIGVVGRNGTGKTTLLRALTGSLAPSEGEVVVGKNTKVAYFDQERSGLDPDKSVFENVAGDQPAIEIGGVAIEPRSYLERYFLFDPHRQRQPVRSLSGGERARVALARLLRQSANLVLLDEPTNDLDVATLGALEEMLVEFGGTAIVVTHDRWFLDRVATSILHFEGDGQVVKYEGNHDMFLRLRAEAVARRAEEESARKAKAEPAREASKADAPKPKPKGGLTFAERKELDGIVDAIDAAEQRVTSLEAQLASGDVYALGAEVKRVVAELDAARAEAARLSARWEELESKKG